MLEAQTALIFNLKFANINFPRVAWTLSMNRKILFLPLKDTFRAKAKLVVLK